MREISCLDRQNISNFMFRIELKPLSTSPQYQTRPLKFNFNISDSKNHWSAKPKTDVPQFSCPIVPGPLTTHVLLTLMSGNVLVSGQVCEAAEPATWSARRGEPRRRPPVPETLHRRCAHSDSSHGDAARQTQIVACPPPQQQQQQQRQCCMCTERDSLARRRRRRPPASHTLTRPETKS